MHLVSYWMVTNNSDHTVSLVSADIISLNIKQTASHILVRQPNRDMFGRYDIPPQVSTEVHVNFTIVPFVKKGRDISLTIRFVDNFGQKRTIRGVKFKSEKNEQARFRKLTSEQTYALSSVIEKRVSHILKDEIERYKRCGRNSGGLGSVQIKLGQRTITGVGSEMWQPDKSHRQNLEVNDAKAAIESDNLQSLLNLHDTCSNDEEKFLLKSALSARLDIDSEYYCVSYFILLAAFRLKNMTDVLSKANRIMFSKKKNRARIFGWLQRHNDEISELHQRYGSSDFLRLLDALLKYEHRNFLEQDLDEVEKFVEGIPEYAFHIRQRISAIHAYRLEKIYGGAGKTLDGDKVT